MSQFMDLQAAGVGRPVMVLAISAAEAELKRLESIGIIPGVEIRILADNGGPILVAVGETRVAVERHLAASVIVA